MKRFLVVLAIVAPILLVACTSHTNKGAGGLDGPEKVTANGHTKEGCLLNLKLNARERNGRLVPDDLYIESNWFMLIFPFLNQEAYQCSSSFVERTKRPPSKDPIYPID